MSDSLVGLNGVLFFAIVFGGFSQGEKPGQRLLAQRVRLITSIKTSLEDSQRALADEILYAIGFMVVSESLLRNADASTAHMEGLLRFVRARGGLKGIHRNRQLCASLMMTEIHLWNHRASTDDTCEVQQSMELTGDYDYSNVTNGRQVIFSLLLMLQKQANARREEVQDATATTKILLALVDKNAPLYLALSPNTVRGHASLGHRFAFLLYTNYALVEFQYSPKATIEFLQYLSRSLTQGSRSVEDEVYRLPFTLLREMPESDLRRLWWVIRVMRAMETVRTEVSRLMHDVLLRQLELASVADIDQQSKDLDRLWEMVEADLQLT